MNIALVSGLIILILLYYGFQPGDSFWLVLTPVAFLLKIPFAVPLLAGLSGSLLTVIPVGSGVVIAFIISYVKQNAGLLTNDTSVDITQKFVQIIRNLLLNQEMMLMIMVMATAAVIVVVMMMVMFMFFVFIMIVMMLMIVVMATAAIIIVIMVVMVLMIMVVTAAAVIVIIIMVMMAFSYFL